MRKFPLKENQSFEWNKEKKKLWLQNWINPDEFKDSVKMVVEGERLAAEIRNKIIKNNWGDIKELDVAYINRYYYNMDQALVFMYKILPTGKVDAYGKDVIPGIETEYLVNMPEQLDSLSRVSFFKRAYKYPLGENQFFIIMDTPGGRMLECFSTGNFARWAPKEDSLKAASKLEAKKLFLDLVREDCGDFRSISITYEDRYDPDKMLAWTYLIPGCRFNEVPVKERLQ